MHLHRLISALVAIPFLVFLIFQGGWWFTALIGVVSVICLREYYRIVLQPEGFSLFGVVPVLGYAFAPCFALAAHYHSVPMTLGLLILNLLAAGAVAVFQYGKNPGISKAVLRQTHGLVYIPVLLSLFIVIRQGSDGIQWVFFILFVVFGEDTGAFYTGSYLGRHKLIPSVSPKKTVEGAVGGLAAGVLLGLLFRHLFLPHLSVFPCLVLIVSLCVLAPIGDLFESVLKREGNVKDSGTIMPGHGGLLDRIDALLFAVPVAYFFKMYIF